MNLIKWLFSRKYRIFYKKFRDTQVAIWEQEFKVAKSRQVREGIRTDRERAIDALAQVSASLEGAKQKKQPKETIQSLEKEKTYFAESVKRYEAQMQMIDDQIRGVAASGDNPGQQGINDTIGMLAELREMYRQFLKDI